MFENVSKRSYLGDDASLELRLINSFKFFTRSNRLDIVQVSCTKSTANSKKTSVCKDVK